MNDAQMLIDYLRHGTIEPIRAFIESRGSKRSGRFEEYQHFTMSDGSRIALADSRNGKRRIIAMPGGEG